MAAKCAPAELPATKRHAGSMF